MVHLFLNLHSNEKSFQFDFPQSFKANSIAVVKVEGALDNKGFVYLSCSLICDTFINERQSNIICKFNTTEKMVMYEPTKLIYHKTMNSCNTLTLKLVDEKNNLIDFEVCDVHIELHII